MGDRYNIQFSDKELREFEKYPTSMGVPIAEMKDFLDARTSKDRAQYQTGIPTF